MSVGDPVVLTAVEARVLGALVEKEITTPDYYPLSLNALVNACNQRSNREPVMNVGEDEVRQALNALQDLQLAGHARSSDGRVAKYEHWLGEAYNFSRAEVALLCVLLLRGPQTPGELRGRTERLHRFDEISDVLDGLQKLCRDSPAPRNRAMRICFQARLSLLRYPQPKPQCSASLRRLTRTTSALKDLKRK
jgi:uncharacterized protein